MLKGFNTKQMVFIALIGALLFVVNFALGSWIIMVTGIPASSGFITGLTNLIFITLCALIIKKFGAVTLMYFVYGILSIPTPMSGGAPGLVWKIVPLMISALFLDASISYARQKKIGFIIGVPVLILIGGLSYFAMYTLLGLPEADKFINALLMMLVVFTILGYIGVWIGFRIYDKLKNKNVISQISS